MKPVIYTCNPKKYIYIKNPKAACSSVLQVMFDWGHINRKPLHRDQKNQAEKWMEEDFKFDYFKFSFVRNPWSRFASLFQDKTKNVIGTKWEMRRWKKYKNHSFEQFAREMSNKNVNAMDRHSRSQHLNLNKLRGLDFYGRVEEFDRDIRYVAKTIGMDLNKVPWKNKTSTGNYREYYNKETIEIVADIYRKDIEIFGYDFDGEKW